MTLSDAEFGREVIRIHALDANAAEKMWWKLYRQAKVDARHEHAWMCLSQLRMLLSSERRERESLRVTIRLVREHRSAGTFCSLAYSLERYGWRRLAHTFFRRALEMPDNDSTVVKWHSHARAGVVRTCAE